MIMQFLSLEHPFSFQIMEPFSLLDFISGPKFLMSKFENYCFISIEMHQLEVIRLQN